MQSLQPPDAEKVALPKITRRYAHFIYGFIQAGITSAVASAVASVRFLADGAFVANWLQAWLTSWVMMVPVGLFAAPVIRRLVLSLTDGEL